MISLNSYNYGGVMSAGGVSGGGYVPMEEGAAAASPAKSQRAKKEKEAGGKADKVAQTEIAKASHESAAGGKGEALASAHKLRGDAAKGVAALFSADRKTPQLTEGERELIGYVERRIEQGKGPKPEQLQAYINSMDKVPSEKRVTDAVADFSNWSKKWGDTQDLRADALTWLADGHYGIRFFTFENSTKEFFQVVELLKKAGYKEKPFEARLKEAVNDFDSDKKATKNSNRDYKAEILKWVRDKDNVKLIYSYGEFLTFVKQIEALNYTVSKVPTEAEYSVAASSALKGAVDSAIEDAMSSD